MSKKGPTYPHPRALRLALARFVEDYRNGESEHEVGDFRAILAGYEMVLKSLRFEKDLDYEKRIADIERRLDERGA